MCKELEMSKIIQVYNTINILFYPHNIQIETGILIRVFFFLVKEVKFNAVVSLKEQEESSNKHSVIAKLCLRHCTQLGRFWQVDLQSNHLYNHKQNLFTL